MSISNYFKSCTATTAGNFNKLFVVSISDITSIAVTAGEVTAITMEMGETFAQANADIDTVVLNETTAGKTRQFVNSELTARFSNKTPELISFVNELKDGVVCGLVVIRVDNNKKVFISGISEDKNFSRPWDEIEATFNSGTSIEDTEEGNAYSVILRRRSITEELPLDSTIADTVLDGTATFIDWTQPA